MERLTYWNCREKDSALPVAINDDGDTVDLETLCSKLAAYEDTGLTPGEVAVVAEMFSGDPYIPISRIAELVKADRVGRLVVAPAEPEKNVPLTLEQLRELNGEPVWVKPFNADGCWCIVDIYGGLRCQVQCVTVMGTAYFGPSYGEKWLAYRNKPKEVTTDAD